MLISNSECSDQSSKCCPICNGLPSSTVSNVVDRRKGIAGTWYVYQCQNCGVGYVSPPVSQEQLRTYYSFYGSPDKIDKRKRWGARHPSLRKLAHRISGDVDPRDFVVVSAGQRVLDYGCGHGHYLSYFNERGLTASGAELSVPFVASCKSSGLDVRFVSDMDVIPFEDAQFDVVYLMQVFEHLANPNRMMEELSRVMRASGSLYLAVPNARSFWRKVFGENWVSGWFPPFHLFHYDSESLARLAKRHSFSIRRHWTATPERWFRLNVKAVLNKQSNRLDSTESLLDRLVLRVALLVFLRVVELFVGQRDCLIVELRKC